MIHAPTASFYGGMKLHNVDSQSRPSGVGELDNSEISTSPVVHSDNFYVKG